MKKLTKIRLINWYTFENETIDVLGNCLISGPSGSGKSTLLDAVQYILTGGGTKFNKAADEKSKRNLESYVRGKTSIANKEYLRDGDITSYIALQFDDTETKRKDIIGAVIEIALGFRPTTAFFKITGFDMEDTFFIEENKPKTLSTFRRQKDVEVIDIKNDIKKMIKSVLGFSNNKYFDYIPKALAFKPIDDLNEFVNTVLLTERKIDLDKLQQNIQNLNELHAIIEREEAKIEELEKIENHYQLYKKYVSKQKFFEWAFSKMEILEKSETIRALQTKIKNLSIKYETISNDIQVKENNLQSIIQDIHDFEKINEKDNDITLYKRLQEKISELKSKIEEEKKSFHLYQCELEQEKKIAKELNFDFFRKINMESIEAATHQLEKYKTFLDEQYKEWYQKYTEYNNRNIEVTKAYSLCMDQLKRLEKLQMPYEQHMITLQETIKSELYKQYHINIEVRPLCEYIEITDSEWTDAIEGYLNTQRFDLIVEPQYFDDALRVYETIKKEKKIYGIGLVNVKKLQEEPILENTLASKIKSNYTNAFLYASRILNQVVCCETIQELKKHKTAITKTCMTYKNHVARQINPAIYQDWYIGKQGYQKQLEKYTKAQKEYQQLLDQIKIALREYNHKLELISESKIGELITKIPFIRQYDSLNKELQHTTLELEELNQNKLLYDMKQKLDQLYQKREDQRNEIEELKQSKNKVELEKEQNIQTIENEKEQVNCLQKSLIEPEIGWEEDWSKSSYDRAKLNNLKKKNDIELIKIENNIESLQKIYNEHYQYDEIPDIATVPKYITMLYQIREKDIVEFKMQCSNLQSSCQRSYQEDFISNLKSNIYDAQSELKELNRILKDKEFGQDGEKYEFIYKRSDDEELARYYDIINSGKDYVMHNLFDETLSEEDHIQMEDLFQKLTTTSEVFSKKVIEQYTDYRNYMSYDIKVSKKNGDTYFFSKVAKEKSGGETQTPFYFIIAASFEQLLKDSMRSTSVGGVVLFDEAFSRMDESRIEAMMDFYNDLKIQLMIAVPPQQVPTIAPYVDTNLLVQTKNYTSFIVPCTREDLTNEIVSN